MALSSSPHAPYWLGVVSATESIFFPIPPDVMLVPMCLAQPKKAMLYAMIATLTSTIGGVLGYVIGLLFYTELALPLMTFYGLHDGLATFQEYYATYGIAIIVIGGFTILPYKIITLSAGAALFPLPSFVVASLLSRGARFFLVALLTAYASPRLRPFIERHLDTLFFLAIALVFLIIALMMTL